jgi:hypothetical protein
MRNQTIPWPEGKRFAFTIFDDPDSQTLEAAREVYAFLKDCGLRTTKAVWPIRGSGRPSDHGATCDDPDVVPWLKTLQADGFEIAYHNATSHTSKRSETIRGLERFAELFGDYPEAMANHYYCDEGLYWGNDRLTGVNRAVYNVLTRGRNRNRFLGHVPDHPYFWGDLCRERIKYVRNFVFADINTLKACPFMPYHDPRRPFVNYWYAASEGAKVSTFNECIRESAQDRLEQEQGACIMYTHFGHGYYEGGRLNPRFRDLIERLSAKNGWFVPVTTLLDFLARRKAEAPITNQQRTKLERRWLLHKIFFGTA